MNITHDLIASVTGPDWKYGLSRILINDEGRGAVFVAGGETPVAEFNVDVVNTSRGTGTTDDGGEIAWRRRGSSCQYKLAKCRLNTATMQSWWEGALEAQAEAEAQAKKEAAAKKAAATRARKAAEAKKAEEAKAEAEAEAAEESDEDLL